MTEPIAVLGATGRTGGSTVRHLRERGVEVRALTRDPAGPSGDDLRRLGAEVQPADMDDEQSLREAVQGVRRLFKQRPNRENVRSYARKFSWEDTTRGQLELFESILKQPARSSSC